MIQKLRYSRMVLLALLGCFILCTSIAKQLKHEPNSIKHNQEIIKTSLQAKQQGNQLQQDCTEYYPRLFFTSSESKMLIKFNTVSPCNRSFVTIIQESSISKFYCSSSKLMIEQKTLYVRYIQNCLVDIKTGYKQFNYTVFGEPSQRYQRKILDQKNFRVAIPHKNQNFNMIVAADWGPMKVRPYQIIYPSLLKRINDQQSPIHAIMLIGDLAYDLSTNQCTQYELFMKQLSVVSPYIPIIPIYGNHDCNNNNNFQIFRQSFECYNLSGSERVQSYQFWNFKIVTFNPYLQIYQKSTSQQSSLMRSALLRQITKGSNQFTVLSSHYPIICSQDVFHCQQTLLVMSQLYKELSNLGKVDLYLGAHMHQYQRVVPFIDGKFMTTKRGNYSTGEMPSIVEGVAGCDVGIIDEDYPTQSFSVSHSFNKTGYGILTVSELSSYPSAKYVHYITPSAQKTEVFDQIQIKPSLSRLPQQRQCIDWQQKTGLELKQQ